MKMVTRSPEETMAAGEALARQFTGGEVILLEGDLGAGKTVFTKGIGRGLGVRELMTSPTFTLLNVYEGRLKLYHFDLYRLASPEEAEEAGFYECADDPGGVTVAEWPERLCGQIPPKAIRVCIRGLGETREILYERADH